MYQLMVYGIRNWQYATVRISNTRYSSEILAILVYMSYWTPQNLIFSLPIDIGQHLKHWLRLKEYGQSNLTQPSLENAENCIEPDRCSLGK